VLNKHSAVFWSTVHYALFVVHRALCKVHDTQCIVPPVEFVV